MDQSELSLTRLSKGLPERRFRPELHGLRGLAILLVVLFHVFGQGRVSGGLDVFLVVSGFLFTGMLLREATMTGRIDAVAYLGRLARRLLPTLLTVVVATIALGLLVLPESRRIALLREGVASVLYVENWELITSQLAYEAAGSSTSVFQHIWSLSVQGQFYVLWPLLTIVAVAFARRLNLRAQHVMLAVAVLVMAVSFPFAMYMHAVDQANAYLNTGTRLWQLAFGAVVALIGSEVLPMRIRPVAGWVGVLAIVTCGFFLDGGTLFPGPWAWWPVLGFALVMWAEHPAKWGVTQVLQLRPFAWIGDISYAFYLWHWPLLVLWLSHQGADRVSVPEGVGIISLSVGLAQLTLRAVDRPAAQRLGARPGLSLVAGAATIAIVAVPTWVGATTLTQQQQTELARQEDQAAILATDQPLGTPEDPLVLDNPGARVLDPESHVEVSNGATLAPDLSILERDQPNYYDRSCRQGPDGSGEVLICDDIDRPEGSPGWEEMPVVVITGGSHAGQWAPALRALGAEHGWRILIVDKSGCQLTTNDGQYPSPRDFPTSPTCAEWNDEIVDVLEGIDPDLVLTIATTSLGEPESTSLGFLDQWEALNERDIPVVALRDNPRIQEPPSECLDRAEDYAECDTPRTGGVKWGLAESSPFLDLDVTPDVGYIDLSEYYCPGDTCPAVIGNVIVYRDTSHMSATYVRTLAAPLSRELRAQAPQLYE